MLKTDYKGFREFMEKIKTAGEEETRTLCGIRQQMWLNEISDFIFPTPAGDLPFLINALEILAQTIKKGNPETGMEIMSLLPETIRPQPGQLMN